MVVRMTTKMHARLASKVFDGSERSGAVKVGGMAGVTSAQLLGRLRRNPDIAK